MDSKKVSNYWGDKARERTEQTQAPKKCPWTDSPLIQKYYIHPTISGTCENNWFLWVKENLFRKPAERALSLGCGDGCLERHGAVIDVFHKCDAFDISAPAIDIAKKKAEELRILERVNYDVADINKMRLKKYHYDVAFCSMSLHHFENLEHILKEINESLKEGGLFIVNEYIGPNRFQWTDKQFSIANELLRLLPERYRIDPSTGTIRQSINRQTVRQMVEVDPSEAVRSEDIFPLINERFHVVQKIDWGGTIINLLLEDIILNFNEDRPDDMALLNLIFHIEKLLIREGVLTSDFSLIVARKRSSRSTLPLFHKIFKPKDEVVKRDGSGTSKPLLSISFDSSDEYFLNFSRPEVAHRWTEGTSSRILFYAGKVDPSGRYILEISSGSLDVQNVTVLLNDSIIGRLRFDGVAARTESLSFDGSLLRGDAYNVIEFNMPEAKRPGNGDERVLGLALKEVSIKKE